MSYSKLTKTKIKSGLQCKKKLWFDFHKPENEDNNASIYIGNIFGEKLRELDKSGLDLSGLNSTTAIAKTKEGLENYDIIYEAAFVYQNTLIRPDILKRSKDGWELCEAKAVKVKDASPDEIKEVFIKDIAIQHYVVSSCNINITKSNLICIDDEFVYKGDKNYKNLIKEIDLTEKVNKESPKVNQDIQDLISLSDSSTICPNSPMGDHCEDPYPCVYIPRCKAELNQNDIIDYKILPNIRKKELKQFIQEKKITNNIQDIPDHLLTDQQKIVKDCHLNNSEHFNLELKKILEEYDWPFYFMDFETIQQFIPIIKNTKSHESIPFQWSVHKWNKKEDDLKIDQGYSFLDFSSDDIEKKFIESLLKCLGKKGSIFVHNETTEKTVLKKLKEKEICKVFSDEIDLIILRIKDTLPLARKYFYNTKMKGKYSIKQIIKSIPTNISYTEEGNIDGGRRAQLAWYKCTDPNVSNDEKEKEKILLKQYCAKDTFAMYDLVKYWLQK